MPSLWLPSSKGSLPGDMLVPRTGYWTYQEPTRGGLSITIVIIKLQRLMLKPYRPCSILVLWTIGVLVIVEALTVALTSLPCADTLNLGRIQKVDPPNFGLKYAYGVDYRTLRWI